MIIFLTFKSEDDKNKFEYIYNKYKRLLIYKAYEILNDYCLAEDSASEAFVRIYKNLHKIEDPDSNMTISFLVTIVKNTSLNLLLKEKKYVDDEIPETLEDSFKLEDSVLSNMALKDMYKLLNNLDEESKSIFILKFAHDFSYKEIGKMLKLSENHVAIKLFRAKKKLTKLIGEVIYP